MPLNIALLPGDGIGPEVTAEAVRLLKRIGELYGHAFEMSTHAIGGEGLERFNQSLPDETLKACLAADAVLLGAVGHPRYESRQPSERPEAGLLALRQALGGFANLRPAICHTALADRTPFKAERLQGADILIVRELLGRALLRRAARLSLAGRGVQHADLLEGGSGAGGARGVRAWPAAAGAGWPPSTRPTSSRPRGCGGRRSPRWRASTRTSRSSTSTSTPARCAWPPRPASFDVILADNLFGDILSDQAASMAGSLGVLPSATIGGRVDLYEPVHGSAPDIAGQGLANPIGAIASAAMLLRLSARLTHEADLIDHAIEVALASGARTRDLAGPGDATLSTREMGDAIEHALVELHDHRHHVSRGLNVAQLMKLSGADIIWSCLREHGVDTVFGYPGGAILPAYDRLLDHPIRHVLVRHEQSATHMADGYARASGRVGVAVATSGPGATNLVTGIATAMMDSIRRSCASPDRCRRRCSVRMRSRRPTSPASRCRSPSTTIWCSGRPTSRRCSATRSVSPPRAAWDRCWWTSPRTRSRSRPSGRASAEPVGPRVRRAPTELSGTALERAAALIARAERPVILAGHGHPEERGDGRSCCELGRARAPAGGGHAARHRRRCPPLTRSTSA